MITQARAIHLLWLAHVTDTKGTKEEARPFFKVLGFQP